MHPRRSRRSTCLPRLYKHRPTTTGFFICFFFVCFFFFLLYTRTVTSIATEESAFYLRSGDCRDPVPRFVRLRVLADSRRSGSESPDWLSVITCAKEQEKDFYLEWWTIDRNGKGRAVLEATDGSLLDIVVKHRAEQHRGRPETSRHRGRPGVALARAEAERRAGHSYRRSQRARRAPTTT